MDPSIQLHRYNNTPLGPSMGLFLCHLSFQSLSTFAKGGDNNMLERDLMGEPTLPKEPTALEFSVTRSSAFLTREMWPFDQMRKRKELRRSSSQQEEKSYDWAEDLSDLLGAVAEGIVDAASAAGSAVSSACDGLGSGDWGGGGDCGGGDGGGGGE